MHVLVTGATGFVGRHLVQRLVDAGHTVRALVRDPVRAERHLPASVRPHIGDLTKPDTLAGLFDVRGDSSAPAIDAIIHLAAATAGDWPTQHRATVTGLANLLQTRPPHVRRFIHVSTIAVYANLALTDGHTLTSDAPLAHATPDLGPYTRAKREAEQCVRRAADNGDLDLTIVRPGLIYGPRHVLFEHLGKPLPHLPLRIAYGSSRQTLPFTHVDSVCDALLRILTTPQTVNQAYNIVDTTSTTRGDYLHHYAQITHRRQRVVYLPVVPLALAFNTLRRLHLPAPPANKLRTRALSLRYDTTNLTDDTGWHPTRTLPSALAESIDATPGPLGRPLRVAIVGAGMNATYHLRPLARHPHTQIVGVVDKQLSRARTLADAYHGAFATNSLDELFNTARPDVVHLVTPPQSHADLACDLMRRGADVLCEKPLAMTHDECQRMARTAAQHNRSLSVNHNLWFDPRLVTARRLVAAGAIGDLLHIETFRAFAPRGLTNQPDTRAAWLHALPGRLLEDVLPHLLYATLGFLNTPPQLQYARRWSANPANEADDELRLALITDRATANITLSLNIHPDTFTLHIYGSHATLLVDMQNMLIHLQRPGSGPRAIDRARQLVRISLGNVTQTLANAARLACRRTTPPGDMTPLIYEHTHCLINDRPFPLGPQQGEQVVALLEQIWPRQTHGTPLHESNGHSALHTPTATQSHRHPLKQTEAEG